jgi:Uma2 family endonuclease
MGTTKTLLTFEEFERLPDRPGKCELVRGELIELPPAKKGHNKTGERIFLRLRSALLEAQADGEAPELGEACMEMGYRLSRDNYVQPDVSVTYANQPGDDYFEGSPAIAIEIVSPYNSAEDLDTKAALYFEHGAAEVWQFYPKTRHVHLHTPGAIRVIGADGVLTTPLLPNFSIRVCEILGQ